MTVSQPKDPNAAYHLHQSIINSDFQTARTKNNSGLLKPASLRVELRSLTKATLGPATAPVWETGTLASQLSAVGENLSSGQLASSSCCDMGSAKRCHLPELRNTDVGGSKAKGGFPPGSGTR